MKHTREERPTPTLRPLGARCSGIPALTEHRVRRSFDASGNLVQEETGWGPDPYAGHPEGWSFTYTFCATPLDG